MYACMHAACMYVYMYLYRELYICTYVCAYVFVFLLHRHAHVNRHQDFQKATLLIQQPFADIEVALPGWLNHSDLSDTSGGHRVERL